MLSSYREVLRTPGAARFTGAAFIARLPLAIAMLAIVLYVAGTTGSYAQAGALAAAFQVAYAAGAVVSSRIIDRRGQATTLIALSLLYSAGLLVFLLSHDVLLLQVIGVVLAGATQPPIGAVVRARWAHVLAADPDRKRTAFAWESILDELIFTIGPLFTATVAVRVGLSAPLIIAMVLMTGGCLWLAAQRSTAPARHPRTESHGSALRQPGLWLMPLIGAGFGWLFGSYEVTVVAFSEQAGMPGATGIILGLWAACSGIGGLWFGHRAWSMPLQRQLVITSTILGFALIPAVLVRSVPALALTSILAGVAIAPSLITTYALTERLVAPALLTESLTWTNSGMILGYAAGTALAGVLIDAVGTSASFVLPVLGAWSAALLATRATPRPEPSPGLR